VKNLWFCIASSNKLVWFILIWCCLTLPLVQPSKAQDQRHNGPPFTPKNRWMTIPVVWLPSADVVPAKTRLARDTKLDQLIGFPSPLTPQSAVLRHQSGGAIVGIPPELPSVRQRNVLIAQFASYHSVLSATGRSVYTEIFLQVRERFGDTSRSNTPNLMTLIVPGGTVRTQSGSVISYLTQPRQYALEPGRTYLLVTSFSEDGDYHMLARSWDVSDGIVQPNFFVGKDWPSSLTGLTYQQLVNRLKNQLDVRGDLR
jgi:hypothetical protein